MEVVRTETSFNVDPKKANDHEISGQSRAYRVAADYAPDEPLNLKKVIGNAAGIQNYRVSPGRWTTKWGRICRTGSVVKTGWPERREFYGDRTE